MNMIIRDARPSDLTLLAKMNRKLIEDEHSRNPMDLDELRERMGRWLKEKWVIKLFLDQDSRATLGYAVYQLRPDEYYLEKSEVFLRQMYIERGRRGLGLGRQAFALLLECFPPECNVVIEVLDANPRGANFWSGVGFTAYSATMHYKKEKKYG
jgi:hypothetical protein